MAARLSVSKGSSINPIRALMLLLSGLMSVVFIGVGLVNLISPDVPAHALGENARVCLSLLAVGLALASSMKWPRGGGVVTIAVAFGMAAVFWFQRIYLVAALLVIVLAGVGIVQAVRRRRGEAKAE